MSSRTTSHTWRPGVTLLRGEDAVDNSRTSRILDNPGSGRVQKVAALGRRAARKKYSRFLVEGPQGVREAVRFAHEHVHDLYITEEAASRHPDILAAARKHSLYIHQVTAAVLNAMSTDAQGIVAVVDMAALSYPEDLPSIAARARLMVVLAQAQDPGNAGTIIRAADAAGADAVILARGSVEVTNPKVVRSTAGSLFHLPVITAGEYTDIVDQLKDSGVTILAADGAGTTSLFESDDLLQRRSAWVFGNEAHGLTDAARAQADAVVCVPIYGQAESLNVATAATVCLYASARAHHGDRDGRICYEQGPGGLSTQGAAALPTVSNLAEREVSAS